MDAAPSFQVALVLGGARSGKSRYSVSLAAGFSPPRLFVATAEAKDPEMAARIEHHRKERGPEWESREAPLDLPEALLAAQGQYGVIVVDCLTMWLTNLMLQDGASEAGTGAACHRLVEVLQGLTTPAILVSNEVGWGVVPDNPLARQFRDGAGWLHQRVAGTADLVVLVVAGLPLLIKAREF